MLQSPMGNAGELGHGAGTGEMSSGTETLRHWAGKGFHTKSPDGSLKRKPRMNWKYLLIIRNGESIVNASTIECLATPGEINETAPLHWLKGRGRRVNLFCCFDHHYTRNSMKETIADMLDSGS